MSFFQRLITYFVNDVAIKTLVNNRAFQRFALKTHYHVQDAKTFAQTGATAFSSSLEQAAPKMKEFTKAFQEEVAKDLKRMKK